MNYDKTESQLSAEERRVKDFIRRGDDFMKIEIFKLARRNYEHALALQPDYPALLQKVENVRNLQKKELRTIVIVVSLMAIAVLGIILF